VIGDEILEHAGEYVVVVSVSPHLTLFSQFFTTFSLFILCCQRRCAFRNTGSRVALNQEAVITASSCSGNFFVLYS